MDAIELWENVLVHLKNDISVQSYHTWLTPAEVIECKKNKLVIKVANEFTKNWLEIRHKKPIDEIIARLTGEKIEVVFLTDETEGSPPPMPTPTRTKGYMDVIEDLTARVEKLEEEIRELKK